MKQLYSFTLVAAWAFFDVVVGFLPDFYHTTLEISAELEELAARCPFMSFRHQMLDVTHGDSIGIVELNKGEPPYKFFILAGEHARELFSSEAVLYLVRRLCENGHIKSSLESKILQHVQFRVIPIGNPKSRKKVEKGNWCLRVNENGVDLNRNWGTHWRNGGDTLEQTYPGPKPFSESETRLFARELEEFKPDIFLSVHTGALGMFTPFAYAEKIPPNYKRSLQVLQRLQDPTCKCLIGTASAELPYKAYGSCIDYAAEQLRIPFVFAFEIFDKEHMCNPRDNYNDKISRFHPNSPDYLKADKSLTMSRFTAKSLRNASVQFNSCFSTFNPPPRQYKKLAKKWSKIFLELAEIALQLP